MCDNCQMVSGKQNKLYLQAYINYQSKIQDSGGDSSGSSLSYDEMGESWINTMLKSAAKSESVFKKIYF